MDPYSAGVKRLRGALPGGGHLAGDKRQKLELANPVVPVPAMNQQPVVPPQPQGPTQPDNQLALCTIPAEQQNNHEEEVTYLLNISPYNSNNISLIAYVFYL